VSTRYRDLILEHAPKGYWRLGDIGGDGASTGPVAPDQTHVNDGTYTPRTAGTNIWKPIPGLLPSSPEQKATFFNGAFGDTSSGNGGVQTPSFSFNGGTGITLEAWVRTVSSGTLAVIHADDSGSHRVFQFRLLTNVMQFVLFDSGGSAHTLSGNRTVNDGQTHHVVATYDGATLAIYVDGFLDNSTSVAFTITAQTSEILFGNGQNLNGIAGAMQEGAYYNYALPANLIAAHYSAGVAPAASATTLGGPRLRSLYATLPTSTTSNVSDSDTATVTATVVTAGPVTDKSDTDAVTTVDALTALTFTVSGTNTVTVTEGTPSVALASSDSVTATQTGAVTDAVPPPAPDAETFAFTSTASIAVTVADTDSASVTDTASAATPTARAVADSDTAHVTETASNSSGGHNRTVFGVSLAFGADASSTSIDWTRLDDPAGTR